MNTYELQPGAMIELLQPLEVRAWDEDFTSTETITLDEGVGLLLGLVHWPGDAIIKAVIDHDPVHPERQGLFVSIDAADLKYKYSVVYNQRWLPKDVDLERYWHRMLLARALSVYAEWLSAVPRPARTKVKRLLNKLTEEKISVGEYITAFHNSIEGSVPNGALSNTTR